MTTMNHSTASTIHAIKSSLLRTPSINMAEEAAPVVAEPYLICSWLYL